MNQREYSKPTVTASGCAYATLSSYNEHYNGNGLVGIPVASQTRSNEVVVIPSYGGSSYNTKMHQKAPACGGYYSVSSAYPNYPNTCGQFSSSLCG